MNERNIYESTSMGACSTHLVSFSPTSPWQVESKAPSLFISGISEAQEGGGLCPRHLENSGTAELCSPDPLILELKVLPTL